jgi:aryl-alcohol dehydrogenase-like predicted oxidoreductase
VQAALLFSLDNPGIEHVVFGVDNIEQLTEGIGIADRGAEFEPCRAELQRSFLDIEKSVISPNLWAKKA